LLSGKDYAIRKDRCKYIANDQANGQLPSWHPAIADGLRPLSISYLDTSLVDDKDEMEHDRESKQGKANQSGQGIGPTKPGAGTCLSGQRAKWG
jgi:hypothetical protein